MIVFVVYRNGQTFKRYGADPLCAATCANRFSTVTVCPEVSTDVYECPPGTVIDEDSNKCVPQNKCPESMPVI